MDTQIPLVVDLDGTLLKSDASILSLIAYIKKKPLNIFHAVRWYLKGKAQLKDKLAGEHQINAAVLPYNKEVLDLIAKHRATGGKIVLATASHVSYARPIADHLGVFDDVFATEGDVNLGGARKRDRLVKTFGEKGFDYAGNGREDGPVWAAARKAYVVNPERGAAVVAKAGGNVETTIKEPVSVRVWLKALRIHQWVKNALVFVPLLSSHQFTDLGLMAKSMLAFLLFSLCASSVYLLNDILDAEDDMAHGTKKKRPFAAGQLPISTGICAAAVLALAPLAVGLALLPWPFAACLACYTILTASYSLALKSRMMIDVIALAFFYTLRIIAGAAALSWVPTFWMLAFSTFIFFSLALVKRYTELFDARNSGKSEKTRGRDYYPADLEMLATMGVVSGYLSVLVLALYIEEPRTLALYRYPGMIWFACPLLMFWISRVWLLSHRGQMHEDPIAFALTDRTSIITGALFGLCFWLAT